MKSSCVNFDHCRIQLLLIRDSVIHSLSCFRMCQRLYKQDKSFSFGGNNIEVQKGKTTEYLRQERSVHIVRTYARAYM